MKVSTKGRYGLRVLLDIAIHQKGGPVILRDIAARQGISEKYLWQVINPLKSAGIVNSSRGAKGGYMLAKDPVRITVLEALTVLEGPVCVVDCVDDPDGCERSSLCVTRGVWAKLEVAVKEAMKGITVKDLADQHKDDQTKGNFSYVI